jgi:hypothetical protein
MDISIYVKEFSFDLISKIKNRFKDFHMEIEFHPNFRFDSKNDSGFCPVKLKLLSGYSKMYDEIDYDILSGFELFFADFDYDEELNEAKELIIPVRTGSFFSNLFRTKEPSQNPPIIFLADEQTDDKLKRCKTKIILNCKSWNKSELRVSLFFVAILAELTEGVVYDTYNGRYLSGKEALETFPIEIEEYEESFTKDEFTVYKFEGWH